MSSSNAADDPRAARLAQLKAEVARLEQNGETAPPERATETAAASPTANDTGANDTGESEDTNEEDAADEAEHSGGLWLQSSLRAAPAWLISLIIHLFLLLLLGLWTISNLPESPRIFVLANPQDPDLEEMVELTEFESEPVEMEELETVSTDFDVPDPGEMTLGEFASELTEATQAEIGQMNLPNSMDQIGSLFDGSGKGMTEFGAGMGGAATFFGAKVKGRKFVFVVDNSNSMTRGRLETALNELMVSVNKLEKNQRFFVILFSDTAYPMFHPKPVRAMVPATSENKRKLEYWLPTVQMCLRTDGAEAVKMAISMQPDAIYILGDGAFTDNATKLLTAPHNRKIVINTLGMEVSGRGEEQLRAIAKANNGTFRAVAASPAARLSARARPIPRNRIRGPVWGIKLPLAR